MNGALGFAIAFQIAAILFFVVGITTPAAGEKQTRSLKAGDVYQHYIDLHDGRMSVSLRTVRAVKDGYVQFEEEYYELSGKKHVGFDSIERFLEYSTYRAPEVNPFAEAEATK